MKKLLRIFTCFVALTFGKVGIEAAFSQNSKGLSVIEEKTKIPEGKTYALIVGISKYKNPAIPSLQFADRDAVAFRNYLVASGIDSNNITLLLNENATNGEFWASLNFLTDLAKQGDKVYIYFSGHGDVENKTVVKDAYLLAYDAPKYVYPSGGAIGVSYLKSWIATLSAKGIAVIFIADACRSGYLAGGKDGMEAAAEILKDNWQNETKILSCRPGELSIEGVQWGNGRGLFSYEMINGLSGLADGDEDGKVTLHELNLYLTQKVPEEARPLPQYPMVQGNMEMTLSNVNSNVRTLANNGDYSKKYTALNVRGYEETFLKNLPDSTRNFYNSFNAYLDSSNENGRLLYKAYPFLLRIPENNSTKILIGLMKRNFTASILSEMDRIIDEMLNRKTFSVGLAFFESVGLEEVILARKFLGDGKLMSLGYLPKVLYFEGIGDAFDISSKGKVDFANCKVKVDSAIAITPNSAYLYYSKAIFHMDTSQLEVIGNYKKAIEISPHFIAAIGELPSCYLNMGMPDSALVYSETLKNTDSVFILPALVYQATAYFLKQDTVLGNSLLDSVLRMYQDKYALKRKGTALEVDSFLMSKLMDTSSLLLRYYKRVIGIADQMEATKLSLIAVKLYESVDEKVEGFYMMSCSRLVYLYIKLGVKQKAFYYLEKYLIQWAKSPKDLYLLSRDSFSNPEYDPIRHEPQFEVLMKKYVPVKNKK